MANARGRTFQSLVRDQRKGKRVVGGKQVQWFSIEKEKGFVQSDVDLPSTTIVKEGSILAQNIVAHIANPIEHIKIIGTIASAEDAKRIGILDPVNQLTNQSELSSQYLLGLLLSQLVIWYVYRFIFAKAIRTMHFDGPVSDRIPVRAINFANPAAQSRHDKMVALVERMLELHKQGAKSDTARERIEREIDVTDEKIDALVYELYGLTKEEIKIVEGR